MTDHSIYNKLDSKGRLIRLLTLHSSADGDHAIRCSLVPVALDIKPTFEALSYCWGDANDTTAITVCGKPFLATATLVRALQGLRHENGDRVLWVDAICINQSDLSEKNRQIPLMTHIYSNAAKVVVWLDIDSSGAKIIKTLHQPDTHWDDRQTTENNPLNSGKVFNSMLKIRDFYTSSWWTRIWTVQELLLSKDTEFWCRDRFLLSEDEVFNLVDQYELHRTTCCRDWQKRHTMSLGDLVYSIFKPLETIRLFVDSARFDGTELTTLSVTATMFRHRKATDPRDRLYGFLGMSPELSSAPIDYTKPLKECYAALSAYVLSQTTNLDVLNCIQAPDDMELQKVYAGRKEWSIPTMGLPSWCPDWNHSPIIVSSHRIQTSAIGFLRFDASCGLPSDVILPGHPPQADKKVPSQPVDYDFFTTLQRHKYSIGIGGFHVDTIKVVGDPHEYNTVANHNVLKSWMDLVSNTLPGDAPYPSGQTRERALQRTLRQAPRIIDVVDEEEVILDNGEEEDQTFREWMDRTFVPKSPTEETRSDLDPELVPAVDDPNRGAREEAVGRMGNQLGVPSGGRSFFITEQGYFGMAYSSIRKGDGVFILLGGRTPYVLRPKASEGSPPTKEQDEAHQFPHCFISPAYIEGMMEGEVIDALESEEGGMLRYPYFTVS